MNMIEDIGYILEFKKDNFFLSNFSPSEITVNINSIQCKFYNSEALYQFGKAYLMKDIELMNQIMNCKNPKEAKKLSYKVKLNKKVWDNCKFNWMYNVVKLKFSQNLKYQVLLMNSSPKILIEGNTWKDTYWGIDLNTFKGQNNLGIILMTIRNNLLNQG